MSVVNVHNKSFKFKWHFSHSGFDMSLSDMSKSI
jgi:hypothetical protein